MLNAFRSQLRSMAADPADPFNSIVRKIVGARSSARMADHLRRFVLTVPDLAAQIRHWSDKPGWQPGTAKLHGFVLGYLYSPVDFIPEHSMGLFGYLDDAYMLASVYQRTLLDPVASSLASRSEHPELMKAVPEWLETVRELLPNEAIKMEKLLDGLYERERLSVQGALAQAAGSKMSHRFIKETVS